MFPSADLVAESAAPVTRTVRCQRLTVSAMDKNSYGRQLPRIDYDKTLFPD